MSSFITPAGALSSLFSDFIYPVLYTATTSSIFHHGNQFGCRQTNTCSTPARQQLFRGDQEGMKHILGGRSNEAKEYFNDPRIELRA